MLPTTHFLHSLFAVNCPGQAQAGSFTQEAYRALSICKRNTYLQLAGKRKNEQTEQRQTRPRTDCRTKGTALTFAKESSPAFPRPVYSTQDRGSCKEGGHGAHQQHGSDTDATGSRLCCLEEWEPESNSSARTKGQGEPQGKPGSYDGTAIIPTGHPFRQSIEKS